MDTLIQIELIRITTLRYIGKRDLKDAFKVLSEIQGPLSVQFPGLVSLVRNVYIEMYEEHMPLSAIIDECKTRYMFDTNAANMISTMQIH